MRTGLMVEEPELTSLPAAPARSHGSVLWLWSALGAVLLGSAGHLLIKLGLTIGAAHPATGLLFKIAHYLTQPWVVAGLAIYAAGTVLWVYAVSQRHISFLYPLTALTYAIVAVGGKFFFGESISAGRWAGIAVVILGVAMLQLSDNGVKQ
jgi:multidrug transporter EmrE-like cation transporter